MKSVQLFISLGLFVAGTIASIQQPLSLATCSSCATTYQDCVTADPTNWQTCYNSYTSCAWDAHGPTLLLRISPLAPLAQLNIRDVLLEISITGNNAWTSITLAYPGALSVPRVCPLPLAFLALIPSPNVTCTGIKTGKFVNTTIVIAK